MKVESLNPATNSVTKFAWSHCQSVPNEPGCYALVTYHGDVLYVGLATKSIRSRMQCHLETPEKRAGVDEIVPFWFHYLIRPTGEVHSIERGWLNQAILEDGERPPFNKIDSPL